MGLPVSRLVRVSINLSPLAAARRSFGVLMVAGDSNVISGLERFRTYDTIDGVAADFGVDAPEYKAAALYFGQTPKPNTIMIGRWLRTATAAQNIGGILSTAQKVITNWNTITAGSFQIVIDGVTKTVTGLNFGAVTNLNGVASVINGVLTGGTVAYDGSKFTVTSSTTGIGIKASGTITVSTQPSAADTITINTKVYTFVASSPGANDIMIGSLAADTAANIQAKLMASTDPLITVATYSRVTNVITVTYGVVGTGGNSFGLVSSAGHVVMSASTLLGGTVPSSVGYATSTGSGTDISTQLRLTSSTDIALAPGYAAESPAECAAVLANQSSAWYGLMFSASVFPTNDQSLAVSDFIEALDLKRIYGVTITDANVLSALVTTDLASLMSGAGYLQSLCQYSQNAYAIASLFGRAFSVNFNASKSTITLMYKQEPGITGEDLDTTDANTLQAKRCNVFVDYTNDTMIIQYGVMSGPAYIDEIHGLNWFQDAVQNACFNLLYTSPTKIPQTDSGSNQFVTVIGQACDQAVNNQLVAPGIWTSPAEFGELTTGMFLKTGYYIYAQPMALQADADRAQRICPPIQVAIKLAGAIQELDVIVDVNR